MNRIRSITAGVLVAGLLAGTAAFGQDGRGGFAGGPAGRGRGAVLRGLDLTDTQRQQVRDIRARSSEETRQIADRVRQAMQAQRKAVDAIPVNEGLIRSTTFALAEAQTDAAIQEARINSEIWNLLTEAQREQLTRLRAARESRAEQRIDRQRSR